MSQALSETIRTIRVGISGTGTTASYTLAPGLAQYVESVYIEVTNGATSDVRPTLTLSEQAGVVIAKKRQGNAIPAGDTGSATWALRLDDEPANIAGSRAQYRGNTVSIPSNTVAFLTWDTKLLGADLLDLTAPTSPKVRVGGIYAVSVWVQVQFGAAGEDASMRLQLDESGQDSETSQDFVTATGANLTFASLDQTYFIPTNGVIRLRLAMGTTAINRDANIREANIQRIS